MTDGMRIAVSQFPVSGDLSRNARYIHAHIRQAAAAGAHIVHFPETALPGYAPRHLPSLMAFDWDRLERETEHVTAAAKAHGVWLVLGTMRRDTDGSIRNSVLVVSSTGRTEACYDKRRIYGRETDWYRPGPGPCVVDVRGVRCGFLICYDNCFPELYGEYRDLGVEVVFHSFFNAANAAATPLKDLMWANLIVRAADHGFWISASNSCEPYSPLPASIVRPDGSAVRAKRNVTSLVVGDYPGTALGWTYDNRSTGRSDATP